MATAGDIVKGALMYVQYQEAEEPVNAADFADSVEVLNDMMASWSEDGIRLGFRPVSASGDFVSAPSTTLLAIKQNLAVQLGPMFRTSDSPINPGLSEAAERSLKQLRNKAIRISDSQYPTTMPMGSGNTYFSDYTQDFYKESAAAYAKFNFTGNATAESLTINTPSTFSVITWTVEESDGFTALTDGTARYKHDGIIECYVKAQMLMRGSGTGYPGNVKLFAARNTEHIETSQAVQYIASTATTDERLLQVNYGPLGITKNDVIQLMVESSADEVLPVSGYLEIIQCV